MTGPPTDLIFWVLLPGLLFVLLFAALVYLGRGRRTTSVTLAGLGVKLVIQSSELPTHEKDPHV